MKTYTIVLCGATGDLASRKIIPGLHDMMRSDTTVKWRIIGFAHDKINSAEMMQGARMHIKDLDEGVWYELCERACYIAGDFNADETYADVASVLEGIVEPRLVYCATASDFFVPITEKLFAHKIIHRQDADEVIWHRIAYEKPFGCDVLSAEAINVRITALLNENQIYRVDHYLAKKVSMALPAARMLDESFNELWSNGTIESIQVVIDEAGGIGRRGHYYDSYGVLRDMIQNHILQIVALLLARDPVFDYPELCVEKKQVLDALTVVDHVLGQYEGYTAEADVAVDSRVPTFAALRLSVEIPRWADVPVFVRTGKKMANSKAVVYALFRSNDQARVSDMPIAVIGYGDNEVNLVIGEQEIAHALTLTSGAVRDESELLQAYGRVLEFITQGDKTIFVSFAEIAAAWKVIDAVAAQNGVPTVYSQGSNGADVLKEFNERNNVKWVL